MVLVLRGLTLSAVTGSITIRKAIVGAAHRYQYPQKGQLRADNFSGGENTVRAKLEAVKADPGTGIRTFHPWVFRRSASIGGNSDDGYQP